MATYTVLGPGGYSRPPYASFSGKPFNRVGGPFSVLGPHGYSRPPYASFAGKVASSVGPSIISMGIVTPPLDFANPGVLPECS
jgi:hypothetical protein